MKVSIKLYGHLRDYLPAEKKGKTELDLPEGSTIQDALTAVGIDRTYIVAVNAVHEEDFSKPVQDGDALTLFAPTAGG